MREDRQDWYFTFKKGTKHFGHYVKLIGTEKETTVQVNNKYGNDINFQYDEEHFTCCNKCWEMTELK